MATVRKRTWHNKDGEQTAWVADYFDQNGRRHIKTFERRGDAIAWLDNTKIEVKKAVHTPERQSITVAEAGELWIEQATIDGLERSTVRQYRQHLDLHITPFIGCVKLSALSTETVQNFRNKLLADKDKPRSRDMTKRVVVSLGAILAHAMAMG